MGGTAKYVATPRNAMTAKMITPTLRVRRDLANSPERANSGLKCSRDLFKYASNLL